MTIQILAKQDHITEGYLPQSYLMPVFNALVAGKELYVDQSEFIKELDLSKESIKEVSITCKFGKVGKLIKLIEKECAVGKDKFISVELDNLEGSEQDRLDTLINRVAFEYDNMGIGGLGEEMVDDNVLTSRQLNSYLNKLKKFIVKYSPIFLEDELAVKYVNEFK